jgi:hypothetical protein
MRGSLVVLLPLVLLASCRTAPKSLSTVVVAFPDPETHVYLNQKWASYLVVRTNAVHPERTITVNVDGEVQHPGTFEVPEGTTVLEAIATAGGFTRFSYIAKIYISYDGQRYALLPKRNKGSCWYGGVASDYILKPSTRVWVARH